MSYIANIQGEKISNPINETNTEYTYDQYDRSSLNAKESQEETISGQNMFNGEPVSQYDTLYLNENRPTLERLRTQTETWNEVMEAALVPSIVNGFAMQPFDYLTTTNIDGEEVTSKVCSSNYLFQDHLSPINDGEFTFRCNMVKFKDDRKKRLVYDRYIHIFTKAGDSVKSLEEDLIFEYVPGMTYERFMELNPHLASDYGWSDPMEEGIIINTGIPSTLYNLVKMEYVFPFLGFLNNRAVSWDKTIISVDNIDVFVILDISNWKMEIVPNPNDKIKAEFKYLDLPFQVDYIRASDSIYTEDENGNRIYKYHESYLNKTPIIYFSNETGGIYDDDRYESLSKSYDWFAKSNGFERIFTRDNHIIYEEFTMDENAFQNLSTSKLGILFNKRFTDLDYRFKIKRFNMLCFEENNYGVDAGYELREDFDVEHHQFNILKITLERLFTNRRRFKIFYNTRVFYDQDNVLRIKNRQYLAEQFAQYMEDITSNVEVFIKEVYELMKKDIGLYLDNEGNEYYYHHDSKTFISDTSNKKYNIKEYTEVIGTIEPDDPNSELVKKYPDMEYDVLKIRTEIVHFNNMEEGSTPTDEFIYYFNHDDCVLLLKELALQIFKKDDKVVQDTIHNLIERAYWDNYQKSDPKSNKDYRNEWFLRKNLPEMFKFTLDKNYSLDDMSLLDEVFDFTYNDQVSYKENLIHGLQYVIGYDADKIEASILRSIVSLSKKGSELTPFIKDGILTMSRWNLSKNNNYVMIFKNGELYEKYNTITYDGITFSVEMTDEDYVNTDKFEFVFFLNATNYVLPTEYKEIQVPMNFTSYKYDSSGSNPTGGLSENHVDGIENGSNAQIKIMNAIPCNTSVFDPENLMVLIDKVPDNPYNDQINFDDNKTAYELEYQIESYKALMKSEEINGELTTYVVEELDVDNKINGVHRVTKQGGGEYFIIPSADIIVNTPVIPDPDPTIPGDSSLKGISQYAFQGCGSVNQMSFEGTVEEWNAVSKAEDWNAGMQTININNGGGIICTDGSVLI